MHIVYRADSIIDANLVRLALEEAGMLAFVNGAYLTGGIGDLPAGGLVNVSVADIDIERAQAIVSRLDAALHGGAQACHDDDGLGDAPLPACG